MSAAQTLDISWLAGSKRQHLRDPHDTVVTNEDIDRSKRRRVEESIDDLIDSKHVGSPDSAECSEARSSGDCLSPQCEDQQIFDWEMFVHEQEIPLDNDTSTAEEHISATEIVCYGVICDLKGTYENQCHDKLPATVSVRMESSTRFVSTRHTTLRGRIHNDYGAMMEDLMEESSIQLHVTCTLIQRHDETKRKARSWASLAPLPCSLDIAVYGPLELFENMGPWFQGYDVFLQDPSVCHRDARYCNPQRLSSTNLKTCLMVSEIVASQLTLSPKELPETSDYLDILSSQVDLEETPQPNAIRATLKRHQKQALTFMLDREMGNRSDRKCPDVWEIKDTASGKMFINTVSRVYYAREPPSFYGGIIADPMGLGKTLTMISLIATDLESGRDLNMHEDDAPTSKQDVGATLVIIPPPILGTWEQQLDDHTVPGSLIYRRHHGKLKLSGTEDLATVHVVLTTYHTVVKEWKADQSGRKSPLFSVRWRRIILDEGHYIRNGASRMAAAVCELEAVSRWAVTGTPIQNRLGDLASLLKFVRVYPYADSKDFEADISGLWKSGEDEEAVKRLKRLSACLLLRRAKSTINLPPRHDLIQEVELSSQERAVYDRISRATFAQMTEALGSDAETSSRVSYVNALQRIESLRLFCNLGLYYETRHERTANHKIESEDWSKKAQSIFNLYRGMSPITCQKCSTALGLTDTLLDDTHSSFGTAQYSSCLKFTCNECVDKLAQKGKQTTCGHDPACETTAVSTSGTGLEETDFATSQLHTSSLDPPSKIKALLRDIKSHVAEEKCVVFSAWRLTLDHIKAALDQEGIQSIRFDGKVLQKDRQAVVEKFEKDATVRVMLLTLSCGAVGLTLTSASRAYLVEPHWNPTLEEQALARVHRLRQTREVTTVRLYVRDSFEEEVMKVQDHKKQLAGVLLAPHEEGRSDSTAGALQQLRALL